MAGSRLRPRVLVVDDDPGIRTMLELALSSRGYAVDAIADQDEGWVGRPDVVLLDARLRTTSGREFLATTGLADHPAVVLMTARNDAALLADELGVAGAIRKPFDLDELCELIDRHARGPIDAAT